MRKVRVLKAMPFAEVGEIVEFELDESAKGNGDVYNIVSKSCSIDNMEHWIDNRILEWVEEEKSLEEEFKLYKNIETIYEDHSSIPVEKRGTYLTHKSCRRLSQIARQHENKRYLRVTNEAIDNFYDFSVKEKTSLADFILKAIGKAGEEL